MVNRTIKRLLGLVFGLALGFLIIIGAMAPKVFHEKWLERGSAYEVEYESLYVNALRKARIGFYQIGFDDNSTLGAALKNWQQSYVDQAFTKIPENDGERLLWNLWVDLDLYEKMKDPKYVTKVMPRVLNYLDGLTAKPMASVWAKDIVRLEVISRFYSYFLNNYQFTDMSLEQVETTRWLYVTRLYAILPEINIKPSLQASTKYHRSAVLVFINTLFGALNQIVVNKQSGQINCDEKALPLFLKVREHLNEKLVYLKPYIADSYGISWVKKIENKLQLMPERLFTKHCTNLIPEML